MNAVGSRSGELHRGSAGAWLPMQTHRLTRDIPVEERFDVMVAGGGPAGSAAAICAARLGARVLLAEATGCLGGMGTSGLVSTFGPISDGKRMLVGGFMRELVLTMHQSGSLGPHVVAEFLHSQLNRWVPFRPEELKRLLDEMAQNAGVDTRFFTRVIDAEAKDGRVEGAVISNVEAIASSAPRPSSTPPAMPPSRTSPAPIAR